MPNLHRFYNGVSFILCCLPVHVAATTSDAVLPTATLSRDVIECDVK